MTEPKTPENIFFLLFQYYRKWNIVSILDIFKFHSKIEKYLSNYIYIFNQWMRTWSNYINGSVFHNLSFFVNLLHLTSYSIRNITNKESLQLIDTVLLHQVREIFSVICLEPFRFYLWRTCFIGLFYCYVILGKEKHHSNNNETTWSNMKVFSRRDKILSLIENTRFGLFND